MGQNGTHIRKLTVAIFVLLFTALTAFAQTVISGDLTGTITDQQGAVITDAKVVAKSQSTDSLASAITNKSGTYRFSSLKPGKYTVSVSQNGFKKVETTTEISVGQAARADFRLTIGQAGEVVNVIEQSHLVDSDNANLTTTFSPDQLASIPSPGNDTTAYALTTPGITLSTGGGYGNFSANGLPGNANLFTTNGFDNNDAWNNLNNSGASNLTLGANELQEMTVVTNGYTGQYGRQAGAQVNSVTKSGGNRFHGNALYWWNGRAMNANDWFNKQSELASGTPNTRPFSNNNQYAASIGGPIVKNKLFFFADTEGLREVLPSGGGTTFIPNPAFLNAVVAQNNNPFYQKIQSLYAGASGSKNATPVSTAAGNDGGCGDFIGTIGASPTVYGGTGGAPCASQYFSSIPNSQTEWLMSARVDYNLSDNDRMFARFKEDHGNQATSTDPINPAFSANSVQPAYEGQLQETHIFNSKTVNQFIVGGSWYKAIFGPADFQGALNVFPTTLQISGTTIASLGGNVAKGNGLNRFPSGRTMTQYMVIDDFSRTIGSHNLKFGVNFRGNKIGDYYHLANTGGLLKVTMADLVAGSIAATDSSQSFAQAFHSFNQVPVTVYSLGLYAQDEWKVTSHLSVTAALRADHNSNLTCLKNCFSQLTGPFDTLDHTNNPYRNVIDTGLSQAFRHIEPVAYQPRFGAVYDLGHGTVLRSGIGLFSDLYPSSLMRYSIQSPNLNTFVVGGPLAYKGAAGGSVFDNASTANVNFQSGFASGAVPAATPDSAIPYYSYPNKIKNPKFLQWNFEIEQQITSKGALTLNYVGNHGYNMFVQNPLDNAACVGAGCNFGGLTDTPKDLRFGEIVNWTNSGKSNYNGFTSNFKWRFSNLFQGSVSYTWSHGLDTCSDECIYMFNGNTATSLLGQLSPVSATRLNYGSSDYDTRHAINANYVLTTPRFGNTALRQVAGGWTFAGTVYYHSGYPFSFINGGVSNLTNVSGLLNANVLSDYTGGSPVSCTSPTKACVTTASFVDSAAQNDFGNRARNSFRGAGYFDTDLQIMKMIKIKEGMDFGFGANFFNILNHPNFDLPNNDSSSGTVGTITSSVSATTSPYGTFVGALASGRIIQLHAKFVF